MPEIPEAATLSAAFRSDLAALCGQVAAALDASIDRCARCKVCDTQVNAVMAAVGAEFDRLHAAMEHAMQAAAGSHEGIRLWMLDCGEIVAKHRASAEAAEARAAALDAALRAHTHSFTDPEDGKPRCGGCLRPAPCKDTELLREPS